MHDVDILIVGAGAAGIAAARRLAPHGHAVLIAEAGDRVGGRAHTVEVQGHRLDLGCGWLHSGDRNPWTRIAEAEGHAVDRHPAQWDAQYRDLGFPPAEQQAAGAAFDAWETRLRERPPSTDRASDALPAVPRWHAYLQALSGYINGAEVERLSVADYLAYADADSGTNWRLPQGYGTLVAATLPRSVPVSLGTAVTTIDDRGRRLVARTARGDIAARAILVTVPTTVLAPGALALPSSWDARAHAAAGLPLGLADKLFLALDEGFFPRDAHLIGDPNHAETGSYTLSPFGRPLVEAFFGGAGARALERAGAEGMVAFAIDELAALLGTAIRARLRPVAQSRWGAEPWIGGSYSHALPGRAADRAVLGAPSERLHFAGEACSRSDFSTAHGAYQTGTAAAARILAELAG